jgi:hypothetical protein
MHIGACSVKGNLNAIGPYMGQEAVHTFSGGFYSHFLGSFKAIRVRVNADHPDRFKDSAALQLGQQVGANIAWPYQGALNFFVCHVILD